MGNKMKAQLITPPATEPVTLADAKLHLRVETEMEEDDDLIAALIVTAREQAEHLTGLRLITQTWALEMDKDESVILDGFLPLQSIASDGADYVLDKKWPPRVRVSDSATLTLICGYGVAADIPRSIVQWILLRIGALYEQRENLPFTTASQIVPHSFADALLDPYRIPRA